MMEGDVAVYEVEIVWLMEQANEGRISKSEFRRKLGALVKSTMLLMFLLAGGDIDSKEGNLEVERITKLHTKSIATLSRDVYAGKYQEKSGEVTHEESLAKMIAKVALWGTTAIGIYNLGKIFHREPERRLTWIYGDTIAHCSSCAAQNGQTRTATEWRKLRAQGIYPQSPSLECKGWNCRCQLVEADPLVEDDFRDVIKALGEV